MKNKFQNILLSIAEKHQVPPEEVYRQMQEAICTGASDPNPAVQAKWAALFPGQQPTPEEVVATLVAALFSA